MFYRKNIGIWCILLTLLETTKQIALLEEDHVHNLGIPYDSDLFNKDEIQYFPDYKKNIDEYPNIPEYAPFHRKERDMQEYYDYRNEKDLPNLSKGGLSFFSWWKNEAESKRVKSGTYPPVSNEVTNTDANTTISANTAVSTNTTDTSNAAESANTTTSANTTISTSITDSANTTTSTNTTASAITTDSAGTTVSANTTVSTNTTDSTGTTVSGGTTVSTNTSVEPAALSSDTNLNVTASTSTSKYLTTCICYNVIEECTPIIIATGVTCIGMEDSSSTSVAEMTGTAIASSSNGNTTLNGMTMTGISENATAALAMSGSTPVLNTSVVAANDTAAGQNTTGTRAVSDSTAALNTTGTQAISDTTAGLSTTGTQAISGSTPGINTASLMSGTTAGQNTTLGPTSSLAGSTSGTDANTGTSMPTVLNMFGAGVFLPVYEIPMTPYSALTTPPSMPTKKKKMFHKIETYRDPQSKQLLLKNISNYDKVLSENFINTNSINGFPYTILGSKGDKPSFLSYQTNNVRTIVTNRIVPTRNMLPSGQVVFRKNPFLLNKLTNKNEENECLMTGPIKKFLKPLAKYSNYHPTIVEQTLASSNNKCGELIQNKRTLELSHEPYNLSQNTLKVYNYQSLQSSVSIDPLKALPNIQPENYTVLRNNIQTIQNKQVPDIKNFRSYFVKYNDTYLSQNSNTSINLVDLCKNVTCQGDNYISQCCSRVFGPEKCQGENFSLLKAIPGYFNTTINSTDKTLFNTNATDTRASTTVHGLQQLVGTNLTQSTTTKIENSTSNCSCNSKPKNNRVVRENDMNDFVKFQLMHGMTAPYGKEMINALKEASLEFQKVNREFHSNDPGNILKMNGNGQIHLPTIDNPILSKKEPEGVGVPFSSNKILDDLRATISNSLLQSNPNSSPFQKDRYRFIRNQGLKDQMESIRENNMILDKIKTKAETELQRLWLLESQRREEELLFDRKREDELKELKKIQDLIHREFESRMQGASAKRAILDTAHNHIKQYEQYKAKKGSSYSKPEKNMDNSCGNDDIDTLIFDRYSLVGSDTSNSTKQGSNLVNIEKFPELEINNSAKSPHDDALLLLNIDPDNKSLSEKHREKREGSVNAKNKMLKENI